MRAGGQPMEVVRAAGGYAGTKSQCTKLFDYRIATLDQQSVLAESTIDKRGGASMAVTHTSAADLSTLSLDAAVQLDRLARKQPADLDSLNRFLQSLGATTGVSHPDTFNLQSKPLDFDILDRAFYRVDQVSISHVADLDIDWGR
jgi:hypothetical protein